MRVCMLAMSEHPTSSLLHAISFWCVDLHLREAHELRIWAAGDELQHGFVSLDADQAGFSVSEGLDPVPVPVVEAIRVYSK